MIQYNCVYQSQESLFSNNYLNSKNSGDGSITFTLLLPSR